MSFLAAGLFAKRIGGAVWAWLQHRSFWQLVSMGLCAVLIVQHFQLLDARHDRDAYAKQRDEYRHQIDTIDAASRKAAKDGKQISKDVKDKNDAENTRIAGDAHAIGVRGPGKAVCPSAPAPASGHVPSTGNGDAPGPQVPPADSAAVPWPWLVQRAEQADLNRAEVLAWREWYRRLVQSWPK